jgi:hypothetical protein
MEAKAEIKVQPALRALYEGDRALWVIEGATKRPLPKRGGARCLRNFGFDPISDMPLANKLIYRDQRFPTYSWQKSALRLNDYGIASQNAPKATPARPGKSSSIMHQNLRTTPYAATENALNFLADARRCAGLFSPSKHTILLCYYPAKRSAEE